MNTATKDQTNAVAWIVVQSNTTSEVKCCVNCKTELLVNDNIHHTTFGLDLCEDCLYT